MCVHTGVGRTPSQGLATSPSESDQVRGCGEDGVEGRPFTKGGGVGGSCALCLGYRGPRYIFNSATYVLQPDHTAEGFRKEMIINRDKNHHT